MNPNDYFRRQLDAHERATASLSLSLLERVTSQVLDCHARGNTLLLCGNGGSAALCQHLAAEFVVRFKAVRKPLPALSLTSDTSTLTACANDFGYESLFSRQVEALGRPGDLLFAFSTSGESANICAAVSAARAKDITTVGFTGAPDSTLASLCEHNVQVASDQTARIQECHLLACHLICGFIERSMTTAEPASNISSASPDTTAERP